MIEYYLYKDYNGNFVLREKTPLKVGYNTINETTNIKNILPIEAMEKTLENEGYVSIRLEGHD
uniref:Uncharacterized protein n=1 Tax=viral metagenome TaxID=1070528 RepID=A0A6M3XVT4_9ZZZZ